MGTEDPVPQQEFARKPQWQRQEQQQIAQHSMATGHEKASEDQSLLGEGESERKPEFARSTGVGRRFQFKSQIFLVLMFFVES